MDSYPTISLLADLSHTTVGYQKHYLEAEAVACFRELTAALAQVEEQKQNVELLKEMLGEALKKACPNCGQAGDYRVSKGEPKDSLDDGEGGVKV